MKYKIRKHYEDSFDLKGCGCKKNIDSGVRMEARYGYETMFEGHCRYRNYKDSTECKICEGWSGSGNRGDPEENMRKYTSAFMHMQ